VACSRVTFTLLYIILTEIIIIFNCYGVTATQLTKIVPFYSCNNNTTLKMTATAVAKHVGQNIMNKIHHKHRRAFRWLFIYYGPDSCTDDGTY
jgi:cell division protein YceG involved in septum cleavage